MKGKHIDSRSNCRVGISDIWIILLTVLLMTIAMDVHADIPASERDALIDLYNSTDGENWLVDLDWLDVPGTECDWYGVVCDSEGNYVMRITLPENNLIGQIPSSTGNLAELQVFNLQKNGLTGELPAEMGDLSELQELRLLGNELDGEIPSWIGDLSDMKAIDLGQNQLSGTIPAQLGNLPNLEILYLDGNALTGTIPTQLANLSKMNFLYLNDNELTGTIPSDLGNFSNLKYLYLDGNALTGTIPSQLGNLVNLERLHLNSNMLEGEIPPELLNLAKLRNDESDFRWNTIYTSDEALRDFLSEKQDGGDWESTQAIPPENLAADETGENSVSLAWTPVIYTGDTGGYEVYYATESGGSYTLFDTTADKSATEMTVTGLMPNTVYYFRLRTVTDNHSDNTSSVHSEYTAEISARTAALATTTISTSTTTTVSTTSLTTASTTSTSITASTITSTTTTVPTSSTLPVSTTSLTTASTTSTSITSSTITSTTTTVPTSSTLPVSTTSLTTASTTSTSITSSTVTSTTTTVPISSTLPVSTTSPTTTSAISTSTSSTTIVPTSSTLPETTATTTFTTTSTEPPTTTTIPSGSYHTVRASVKADEGGKIKPSDNISIQDGSSQTFKIKADEGWRIEKIRVDGKKIDLEGESHKVFHTFENVDGDHTIRAVFIKLHTIKVSVTAPDVGSVEPSGEIVADAGQDQTFDIKLHPGYEDWGIEVLRDGEYLGALTQYTLENISEDAELTVNFIRPPVYHSADYNRNFHIDLGEILRVAQLYHRVGYHCAPGTEDGYAPGRGDRSCSPHDSDYAPSDWHISLSEFLRLIQFHSLGGYAAEADSADGFAAGKGLGE